MRTKVAMVTALDRVLDGLGEELLAASDAEIIAAARELGMDPSMRGSAAFLGLKYSIPSRPEELFAEIKQWLEQQPAGKLESAPLQVIDDPVSQQSSAARTKRKSAARRKPSRKK
jgi:hypothetical protein